MKNRFTHFLCVCLVLVMALQFMILPTFAAMLTDEDFLNAFPALKDLVADKLTASGLNTNKYGQSLSGRDLGVYEPTDRVNAVVKLSGPSILSLATEAGMSAADYVRTGEGQAKIAEMTAAQDEAIRRLGDSISDVKHRYTTLFSGFSCTTEYQNLAKIEGLFAGSSAIIGEKYISDKQESTATDNALNDDIVGNLDFNHMIQTAPFFEQQFIQSFRLRQSSGKTVQNKAVFAIGFVQPLGNNGNNHPVGNKVTFVDQRLGLQSYGGSRPPRISQHLARRQMGDLQSVTQQPRLCSFTAPRRSH